ncbi:hypothetical protein DTO271G3_1418 [Paecilomyces variotii]|nr:hypothetical protein DTO271G3_1418 [Paecilomyces variotii]
MDKIQNLRRECRGLGLSAKGSKSTLLKRIHEVKSRIVTSQSDEFVDAMVAALVEPDNDAGMITRRKAALQSSIDDDPLYTDNVRGKHFVGNRNAMRFANARQEGEGLADKVQRLDEELKKLRQDHDDLRDSIAEHREVITHVEDIALDFRYIRNRFLSVYKRDKMDQENSLNALTWSDKYWVKEGNQAAHGGHCKRDAELYYDVDRRSDSHVYAELYGFHPAVVRTIGTYLSLMRLQS